MLQTLSQIENELKVSSAMGRLVGIIIVIILIALVVKAIRAKNK